MIPNHFRSKQHIALKILTADSFGTGHNTFELDILKHIRRLDTSNPVVNQVLGFLDEFEHHGPHDNHVYIVRLELTVRRPGETYNSDSRGFLNIVDNEINLEFNIFNWPNTGTWTLYSPLTTVCLRTRTV